MCAFPAWVHASGVSPATAALVREAIAAVCAKPQAQSDAQQRQELPGGAALSVVRIAPGGRLREVRALYEAPAPNGTRPELLALAGPDCAIRYGRTLAYSRDGRPRAIGFLRADLSASGAGELLDAPVPAAPDPGGVAVAHIDSGVNYLLPGIASRLARDADGAALGYDWWDMDPRPFDQDPSRSAFFPQRHGTRTASLLLEEAPVARLIPYRYPRPEMSRMASVVEAAAKAGVRIVTLAMGSNQRAQWDAYAQAVRRHPEMLFIVSAGNDGRDIDRDPVYPAALKLPNQVAVTSSEDDGRLASGSSWGRSSVDLLVPAEKILVTGFDGRRTFASGASYAVARVGALAACLLAAHPQWQAKELRAALLAQAHASGAEGWSAHGFLPDPVARERGACPAAQAAVLEDRTESLSATDLGVAASGGPALVLNVVAVSGSGWQPPAVRAMLRSAAPIFGQCGIALARVSVHYLSGPERLRYFTAETAEALIAALAGAHPSLVDTVWIVRSTPHPGIALAHELVHVLSDRGEHSTLPDNLMREETAQSNRKLTAEQCRGIVERGSARGLLVKR